MHFIYLTKGGNSECFDKMYGHEFSQQIGKTTYNSKVFGSKKKKTTTKNLNMIPKICCYVVSAVHREIQFYFTNFPLHKIR